MTSKSLTICFFEDKKYNKFYPLTYCRPVYLLRSGIVPLFRRVNRYFEAPNLSLLCRDIIAPLVSEEIKDIPVNIIKKTDSPILLINGRIKDYGDLPKQVAATRLSTKFFNNDELIAILLDNDSLQKAPAIFSHLELQKLYNDEQSQMADFKTTSTLYNRSWELVDYIDHEIATDFEILSKNSKSDYSLVNESAILENKSNIFLSDSVTVHAGTILDASKGPIFIGSHTTVEAQAAIKGPCYIGPNSVIVSGKIEGSSIGHTCRAGGEIEESIFHSYVNKYHAGFIGHSYVGSWVNFGAMTTNSDLKNNYSNIRVTVEGESIDSGSIKVGSFIGDHTKFGIGSLLNTGINIGVCCNIFGGGITSDKEIKSFSWGNSGNWQEYKFEKAIETARRTADRRQVTLSAANEKLLQAIAENNSTEDGLLEF